MLWFPQPYLPRGTGVAEGCATTTVVQSPQPHLPLVVPLGLSVVQSVVLLVPLVPRSARLHVSCCFWLVVMPALMLHVLCLAAALSP